MEFLEPIKKGLEKDVFRQELENRIESATNALMCEVANSDNPPPLAKNFSSKQN